MMVHRSRENIDVVTLKKKYKTEKGAVMAIVSKEGKHRPKALFVGVHLDTGADRRKTDMWGIFEAALDGVSVHIRTRANFDMGSANSVRKLRYIVNFIFKFGVQWTGDSNFRMSCRERFCPSDKTNSKDAMATFLADLAIGDPDALKEATEADMNTMPLKNFMMSADFKAVTSPTGRSPFSYPHIDIQPDKFLENKSPTNGNGPNPENNMVQKWKDAVEASDDTEIETKKAALKTSLMTDLPHTMNTHEKNEEREMLRRKDNGAVANFGYLDRLFAIFNEAEVSFERKADLIGSFPVGDHYMRMFGTTVTYPAAASPYSAFQQPTHNPIVLWAKQVDTRAIPDDKTWPTRKFKHMQKRASFRGLQLCDFVTFEIPRLTEEQMRKVHEGFDSSRTTVVREVDEEEDEIEMEGPALPWLQRQVADGATLEQVNSVLRSMDSHQISPVWWDAHVANRDDLGNEEEEDEEDEDPVIMAGLNQMWLEAQIAAGRTPEEVNTGLRAMGEDPITHEQYSDIKTGLGSKTCQHSFADTTPKAVAFM
eukprot:g595.t1